MDARGDLSPAEGKGPDAWCFNVTAYGWLTNLSGSATARSQTVDINGGVFKLLQKSDSLGGLGQLFRGRQGPLRHLYRSGLGEATDPLVCRGLSQPAWVGFSSALPPTVRSPSQ